MAFNTPLSNQLLTQPAPEQPSIYTMTPEQIYAQYGVDSSNSGQMSAALDASRREALYGLNFNYGGQSGEGAQVAPQDYTVTADNYGSLYNDRDLRGAMMNALQTQAPDKYAQYTDFNNRLMNEIYPQSYQTYTAPKTGVFGHQIDNFMDKYGKYIPMAVGAYMGGAALAPELAGAGTAAEGGMLGADAEAVGGSIWGIPEAAGATGGATGATELASGLGLEEAAGTGMGEWVEPATGGSSLSKIAETLQQGKSALDKVSQLTGKQQTQPQMQQGAPVGPTQWMNLGNPVDLGDFMSQAMRYGQQQDFSNYLNKKPYGYGGM